MKPYTVCLLHDGHADVDAVGEAVVVMHVQAPTAANAYDAACKLHAKDDGPDVTPEDVKLRYALLCVFDGHLKDHYHEVRRHERAHTLA